MDGIVDVSGIEEGEFANEGVPVFRIVNIDRVKVVVDVPEKDIMSVEHGSASPFRVLCFPGRTFTGTVSFVSMQASRESNSFRTELLAENPGHALRGGMIAEVTWKRRTVDDAVLVPLAAVIPKKGEHVAFVVEDGRAVRRVVRIDAFTGEEALLASGIRPGDELVIEGQRALQDGAPVEVQSGGDGAEQ